jgi:5-methylcytosine-specific restriction endonuclease McrA
VKRKTPLKRYSKEGLQKRKEERKDYPEFYQRHIQKIKTEDLRCDECGCGLLGDVSEVAHVLPKSTFKSISLFDENVIYLCGWKQNNCHAKYDNSDVNKLKEMKIYPKICRIFAELEREIEEKINYKTYERYGWLL